MQDFSISIILVRPQFSGNLGSVARAMKNMGLRDLRLVAPEVLPTDRDARQMAAHSEDILDQTHIYQDLQSALQNFDRVIGTSRRHGKERGNWRSPRELGEGMAKLGQGSRVAILFGAEDTGLTNEEITLCHEIVSIPSDPNCPSLNLAQAVMIIVYELRLALALPDQGRPTKVHLAKFQDVEAMYEDLHHLLDQSGFLDKNNPDHIMRLIRNMFDRAHLTDQEVRILRGVYRQLRWWGSPLSSRGPKSCGDLE